MVRASPSNGAPFWALCMHLYTYGLHSWGLYSDGLYSYGLYSLHGTPIHEQSIRQTTHRFGDVNVEQHSAPGRGHAASLTARAAVALRPVVLWPCDPLSAPADFASEAVLELLVGLAEDVCARACPWTYAQTCEHEYAKAYVPM